MWFAFRTWVPGSLNASLFLRPLLPSLWSFCKLTLRGLKKASWGTGRPSVFILDEKR